MKRPFFLIYCFSALALYSCRSTIEPSNQAIQSLTPIKALLPVPRLVTPPIIDGDLSEWADRAFTDGLWDLERLQHAPWYHPGRNRLANHGETASLTKDLSARYYMAWDSLYLYLGAAVHDNKNDVTESRHAPKRWYYKDAIAWFIEAPLDTVNEVFGEGDHGFAFVIDTTRPDYGAWWRHGTADTTFLEEPLAPEAVEYVIRMNPWGESPADYMLEARIDMAKTFGQGDPAWHPPKIGDQYAMMIVHCDPDGGEYGGHLLIHGQGDPDSSWTPVQLVAEKEPIQRKER